jgi:hypothetical protein
MSIFVPRPNEINAIRPSSQKKLNPMGNVNLIGASRKQVDFGGPVKFGGLMTKKAQAIMEKLAKKLTTEAREHISKKNFAEPGKKKYPIEDKNHARNALARVSQHGSPAEKAQVRAKVHAKYPDIGEKTAKKHMPHFTDQNRDPKAKEVFRALKKEHPEYSAGKKARIAEAVANKA